MKKYNVIAACLFMVMVFAATSCHDYLDVNTDPNNPTKVSSSLLLTGILANFSYEIIGGFPVRVTNTWVKQTTYNAVLPTYDNYQLTENDANNLWTFYSYGQVMQNCKVLADKADADKAYNYSAIARIILAWNVSIVTDLYGNAPYTQALQGDKFPQPAYDKQESIYENIQALLDQAIRDIEQGKGLFSKPAADDFIFQGVMDNWRKVAFTLKARFYMRLTYSTGYDKKVQAQRALDALASGMKTLADDAKYLYLNSPGQENPWYQYAIDGKWDKDTQVSTSYITLLTGLNDPRIHAQVGLVNGNYTGHENGLESEADLSPIGEFYSAANAPVDFISTVEAKLIAAEAYFLLGNRTASETSLKEALTLSFEKQKSSIVKGAAKVGKTETDITQEITTYITAQSILPADDKEAYKHLMTQKYIANFLQFETYNDWRRTGYPEIKPVDNPYPAGLVTVPLRFPYPSAELQYNSVNVNAEGMPIGFRGLGFPVWWNECSSCCTICGAK